MLLREKKKKKKKRRIMTSYHNPKTMNYVEYTHRIFNYARLQDPKTWQEILKITRLHKLSSVERVFSEHLKYVEDISIFNKYQERIPLFLLKFAQTLQRNSLSPGDSFGSLLTCRATKIYTQSILDQRHLKNNTVDMKNAIDSKNTDLNFEISIYTTLNQIYEITNKRKFTTIFVQNYTVEDLLKLKIPDMEYLSVLDGLKTFIVTESFIPGYLKIILKSENKNFILRHINQRNILGFTDLKHIYEKCGLVCYFFNLIKVVKLQFFKSMIAEGIQERDIMNILKYQIYVGKLLPLNRNGLRKNVNRSGLDKFSFEAIKQNYASESVKNKRYPVQSSIEKIFFGQQFKSGTGYDFALLPKTDL